jgi:hypothetical protein
VAWIPGYERRYYNPTTNRVPGSILSNWLAAALGDARGNQLPGEGPNARYDDIPSPWTSIRPKVQTIPIVPTVQMTIGELKQKTKAKGKANGAG